MLPNAIERCRRMLHDATKDLQDAMKYNYRSVARLITAVIAENK